MIADIGRQSLNLTANTDGSLQNPHQEALPAAQRLLRVSPLKQKGRRRVCLDSNSIPTITQGLSLPNLCEHRLTNRKELHRRHPEIGL